MLNKFQLNIFYVQISKENNNNFEIVLDTRIQ